MTTQRFNVGDQVRRIVTPNGINGHHVGDVDVVTGVSVATDNDWLHFTKAERGLAAYYELVDNLPTYEELKDAVVAWASMAGFDPYGYSSAAQCIIELGKRFKDAETPTKEKVIEEFISSHQIGKDEITKLVAALEGAK